MINPIKLMQIKGMGERFQKNHPRIPGFFNAAMGSVREGSVIEMSVTDPEGKKLCANIRVTADDMDMLRQLAELSQNPQ